MKTNKTNKYLVAVVILLFSISSAFQISEDPHFLETLKNKLREYNTNYPEEKIYLQFDKPFYKPGEDIWFNAFVLNSNTHKPSLTSEVVYVELVDPKGAVASQSSLVVKEGTAHGDFALLENAPGGLYQVRAYTQWMKNFGEENLFKKEIQVQRVTTPRLLIKLDYEKESYGPGNVVNATLKITNLKNEKVNDAAIRFKVMIAGTKLSESTATSNTNGEAIISFQLPDSLKTTDGLLQAIVGTHGVEESISRSIPIVLNKITLQFYPEGGHWVDNVNGSLAFKALNEFGKGADISGIIVDEKGKIITSFESFHMGMGAFKMVPASGKKYFAKITSPVGNESLIPLPAPLETGFTFQLQSITNSRVKWDIHAPMSTEAYIVGQSHGEIAYASKLTLRKGENTIEVPTENFPAGIGVFTLFDYHGTEQCERLAFLKKDYSLNIKIKTDKAQYSPGEEVQVKVETTDRQGKAIPSKLSLSVVDDQLISFADDKQNNILSYMLLSSEVQGEIQEPSFYFDGDEPKSDKALDYLLMTQGWRRFSWKEMTDMKRPIVYNQEKVKNLSGRVIHNGLGFHTEITLVELGNKQRIDKIETTLNGYFLFKNIDPTVPVLLLAKKPGEIVIQKEEAYAVMLSDKRGTRMLMETIKEHVTTKPTFEAKVTVSENEFLEESKGEIESGLNITLEEDVAQLSEVVVTGYGFENKSSLSGSYTTLYQRDIAGKLPMAAIEGLLQGRVAGVVVQPQTGNAGSNAVIRLRGNSSLAAGRAEPLYVIDGHPMASSLNQNFSTFGIVGPEDIQTIEVVASPEAASLFGSAAVNGVILITTKSHLGYTPFKTKRKLSRYNGETIQPRRFSATREFYVPPPPKDVEKREDFRTTLYWNHTIVTDERGIAEFSFYNNDAVSSFRITAEGFSRSGVIGRTEEVYSTHLPFSLDAKLPEFIGFEDTLRIPVQVKNESLSNVTGTLEVALPSELSILGSHSRTIQLKPGSAQTFSFTVTSNGAEGEFPLAINLTLPGYHDKVEHALRVQPVGFPTRLSFSSKELDKKIRFSVDEPERGTMKAELVAFPDVISDLFTGAEAILQEPHGCFEQVSSSTFPNILVLQFLKRSGMIRPQVERLALRYIEDGYQKLKAYEIKSGGFEWFGHPPAHEGLTAYGLVEFYEMKKVFPSVSNEMLDRTREWLLSRRDGKGGFKVNGGKYGFSGASPEVSNAYLTYALSETGTNDILPEYVQAYQEAIRSEDMYRLALMACASYNLNKIDNYNQLINMFTKRVLSIGFGNLKAEHSIVRSYGQSLSIETISLWTIALLKSSTANRELIATCINHILNSRMYGQFGSTQGTTLALKALTEYATLARSISDDGEIQILVDNLMAEKYAYQKEEREKITLNNFSKNIEGNGDREMRIVFQGTKEPLPYTVTLQWHTKKPQRSDLCKVNLTTQLSATKVTLNETVRLKATLKNKTSEGLPMITAVIGIPAGLSVQPWQLKELKEKQAFDFYETRNGNLILYYREMAPGAIQIVNLDLKAEIPGTFTGSASSAYLYYTNEFKDWIPGNSITIN